MKILFITRHYLDQKNGGSLGARAYLDAFSCLYEDLTLLYPNHKNMDISNIVNPCIKLIPCDDNRSLLIKGLDIYRGKLHRFASILKRILSEKTFDIIVFDHSILGAELLSIIKAFACNSKVITIHCNVETIYNKDNPVSLLYRFPYTLYIEKAEKDCLNNSFLNLTVTKEDASFFKREFNITNIEYWGTFEHRNSVHFALEASRKKSDVLKLVISGSLGFPQTNSAIVSFLTKYYPIIKSITPNVKLVITGRNPTGTINKLCSKDKSIRLVPNPNNIFEVIKQGDIYISPIFGGSGVKLRIMDGLKLGLPVLCHEASAKGYEDIVSQKCMFTYHDEETFKTSYKQLLASMPSREVVFDSYIHRFSFNSGTQRLCTILQKYNLL